MTTLEQLLAAMLRASFRRAGLGDAASDLVDRLDDRRLDPTLYGRDARIRASLVGERRTSGWLWRWREDR